MGALLAPSPAACQAKFVAAARAEQAAIPAARAGYRSASGSAIVPAPESSGRPRRCMPAQGAACRALPACSPNASPRRARRVLRRHRDARAGRAADGHDHRRRLRLHVGQPRHRQTRQARDGARRAARAAAEPASRGAHRASPRSAIAAAATAATPRSSSRRDANSPSALTVPVDKLNAMGKGPLVARAARIRQGHRRGNAREHRARRRRSRQLRPGRLRRRGRHPRRQARTSSCTRVGDRLRQAEAASTSPASRSRRAASCGTRRTRPVFASALGQAVTARQSADAGPTAPAATTACAGRRADKPPPGAPPGLYLSAGLGPTSATLDSPVHWRITKAGADGQLVRDTRAAQSLREARARHLRRRSAARPRPRAPDGRGRGRRGDCRCASISTRGVLKMQARAAERRPPLHVRRYSRSHRRKAETGRRCRSGSDATRSPRSCFPAGEYVVTRAERPRPPAEQRDDRGRPPAPPSIPCSHRDTLELSGHARHRGRPGRGRHRRRDLHPHAGRPRRPAGAPRGGALGGAGADLHAARRHLLRHRAHTDARRCASSSPSAPATSSSGRCRCRSPTSSLSRRSAASRRTGQRGHLPRRAPRRRAARDRAHHRQASPSSNYRPGRYRIEASLGGSNVIAATDLTLAAGQAQKVDASRSKAAA